MLTGVTKGMEGMVIAIAGVKGEMAEPRSREDERVFIHHVQKPFPCIFLLRREVIIRARHQDKNRVVRRLSCTSGPTCRCEESALIRFDFCALGEVRWLMENLPEIFNRFRLASERW
jgi:hypothetical protein